MRTAIDSNVLMAAFRGDHASHSAALAIIDDPNREFLASAFVKLEVLPKAIYENRQEEREFYEAFFQIAEEIPISQERFDAIIEHARTYGLSGGDSIVTEAAIHAGAEQFVTAERSTKPMFRIPNNILPVISIHAE